MLDVPRKIQCQIYIHVHVFCDIKSVLQTFKSCNKSWVILYFYPVGKTYHKLKPSQNWIPPPWDVAVEGKDNIPVNSLDFRPIAAVTAHLYLFFNANVSNKK